MAYLAGIDIGTSSLKVVVMDEHGKICASASRDYQYDSPKNGYSEQNVDVWWNACVQCLQQITKAADSANIAGIGFSGQMHSTVFLDKHMQPVRPAILHLDTRSDQQIRQMMEKLPCGTVQSVLMNPLYPGFLLPSLLWIKENEPDNFNKICHVMMPKDYLRYRLCGELHTDYTDASATLAFDIRNRIWAKDALKTLGISIALFPPCIETDAVAGKVTASAAGLTGLREGTAVIAGGGDQVMQAIGNGVVNNHQVIVNIGTSAQVSFQSNKPLENTRLGMNTFCGYSKERWYTMGAIMSGGLSLQWLGTLLGLNFHQMDTIAGKEDAGAGGLLFFPYLQGERTPHMDPNIRGVFYGLSTNTNQGRMARAVMEGVAYSLRECMELCCKRGLHADEYIASGGGAKSALWLQMQADIYGVSLKVANVEQHACVGAAIAAGAGAGIYSSISDGCKHVVRYNEKCYYPNMEQHEKYTRYYQLFLQAFRESRQTMRTLTILGKR